MSRTSDEEKHLSQDSNLWVPGFEPRQHYWGEGLSPWHHIFSLAPSFFLGVSSVWKQTRLRAIKVYRAMDHGNVKRFRKGRWQGSAFFSFRLSHVPCTERKSLQSLSITNPLERAWARGSTCTALMKYKDLRVNLNRHKFSFIVTFLRLSALVLGLLSLCGW